MRKLISIPLMILAIALIFPSCVSKKKFTELMSVKDTTQKSLEQSQQKVKNLEENVATLESQVSELSDQKSELENQTSRLNNELSTTKSELSSAKASAEESKKMAEMSTAENNKLKAGIKGVFAPYQNNGLSLVERNNQVLIALPEEITFRSGSSRLSKSQREALQNVANTLVNNPSLKIVVEGHTDWVPMKEGAPWESNTQLSRARARSVVNALVRLGASANQLSTVARTQDRPAPGTEMTPEMMAQSRRADLVITANPVELYRLNQSL